jgi:pimeloyl-ACP methyl ester carboxylesterase
MIKRSNLFALAGAAVGLGAGVVAERSMLNRRRRNDPEAAERFGTERGERSRRLKLSDGAVLFVEESGPRSRRGAVFVHGSALRTDVWHYQLGGIDSHRLVFYDLRGHGLSQPKGDGDFSIATLAGDLLAVIDDARLKEVVIVGHSIGGMIALDLCLQRPDLLGGPIKGLVLANTTYAPAAETLIGGAAVSRFERFTRRPLDVLGSQARSIERLRRVVKPSDAIFWTVAMTAFGPGASARQIDFTYDMLAETPADLIFDLVKAYRDFDVRDRLGEVTVPALIIGGTNDRLTVCKASEYLAERLPKAELELLNGCGHMTMLERHRDFNRLVTDFLNDVLGRPTRKRKQTTVGEPARPSTRGKR